MKLTHLAYIVVCMIAPSVISTSSLNCQLGDLPMLEDTVVVQLYWLKSSISYKMWLRNILNGVRRFSFCWMVNTFFIAFIAIPLPSWVICFRLFLMFWIHPSIICTLEILTRNFWHLQLDFVLNVNLYRWMYVNSQRIIWPNCEVTLRGEMFSC